MTEPKGSHRYGETMRPWFWWWRFPPALGMMVLAFALPTTPSVFGHPVIDHFLFALAAVLLVVATFSPPLHLGWRITAMGVSVLACGARASILILVGSGYTAGQVVSGVTTWTMLAGAFAFATVVTDRVRVLSR